MELTVFLAKVLGIAMVVVGAAIMLRRDYYLAVFGTFAEQRMTRVVIAIIELIAALSLVVAHTAWSPFPAALISLIGWMAVVEATACLLLPDAAIRTMLAQVNTPAWYLGGGIFAIALGAYLAGFGFGWW